MVLFLHVLLLWVSLLFFFHFVFLDLFSLLIDLIVLTHLLKDLSQVIKLYLFITFEVFITKSNFPFKWFILRNFRSVGAAQTAYHSELLDEKPSWFTLH